MGFEGHEPHEHSKFGGTCVVVPQRFGRSKPDWHTQRDALHLFPFFASPFFASFHALREPPIAARRSEDKTKTLRQQNRRSVSKFIWPRLADLRAQETAVIFHSHSAAAE